MSVLRDVIALDAIRTKRDARKQRSKLCVVPADALADKQIPPRGWLVRDMIPDRNVSILSGDGGTGKSLLALQLAVATVTGTDWVGGLPEKGPVLFVSAEDDIEELHRRLDDIARSKQMNVSNLAGLDIVSLVGRDAILAVPKTTHDGVLSPTLLFQALKLEIEARKPVLLILDTLADLFGGDEIKRPHARQFIGMLRGLTLDFNLAVLLISHPSQSGMASGAGTSGSTGWNNSVRSRLYLERPRGLGDGDPDVRVLTTKKANYGRAGDERVLRWRDGVFILDGAARPEKLEADAADDRLFLALLAEFSRCDRPVSANKSSAFAPSQFANDPSAKGISSGRLAKAMGRLFASNRIHIETSGPLSKQRQRIVAGPPPAPSANLEDDR